MEEKDYVEYCRLIVAGLCSKPDEVRVQKAVDEMGVLLTIHVAKDDMSTIIGKQGGTADAIRTLVRNAGAMSHARVHVKIAEPEGSEFRRMEPSSRRDGTQ